MQGVLILLPSAFEIIEIVVFSWFRVILLTVGYNRVVIVSVGLVEDGAFVKTSSGRASLVGHEVISPGCVVLVVFEVFRLHHIRDGPRIGRLGFRSDIFNLIRDQMVDAVVVTLKGLNFLNFSLLDRSSIPINPISHSCLFAPRCPVSLGSSSLLILTSIKLNWRNSLLVSFQRFYRFRRRNPSALSLFVQQN